MCKQKMRALSYIGAEKITFPPKPDRQTYIHTDGRTDIGVYRVAPLLKSNLRCKEVIQILQNSYFFSSERVFKYQDGNYSITG